MCGIAGYVATRPVDEAVLKDMTDILAHRGPDGRGVMRDDAWNLALGHRRLAIIDLDHGAQPMESACGRYVVVFNGEIYNYRELRRELEDAGCAFRTESDTEVLLRMFIRHGEDACDRLDGMFAFAVADRRKRTLFLARDPMGEKPLVYTQHAGGFAFASEVKALLLFPGTGRRVDAAALHHYLSLNYVPGEATMMAGVRRVPPGGCLTLRQGRLVHRRYYRLPCGPAAPMTLDDAVERFDSLLDDSVRLRLRSDVPVGVFLSSGIDSSLIASSAARMSDARVTAFTIGFDDPRFDERPDAARTARLIGLPLQSETVPSDARPVFNRLVWHADDPLADSSALPTYHLCRMTSRHRKVALGGDGADELFAGYLTHRATLLGQRYRRIVPGFLRDLFAAAARCVPTGSGKVTGRYKLRRFTDRARLEAGAAHLAFNGTWMEIDKRRLYDPTWARHTADVDSFHVLAAGLGLAGGGLTPARLLAADQRQYLPDDILTKTDRMSMAWGLEVRSPYLDRRIVEFAATLPDALKLRSGTGKVLLRALALRRGLGAVGRRRKRGFSIPVHAWLRGPLRRTMLELLDRDGLESTGIFDPSAVRARVDDHLSGRSTIGFELWGLMVFMAWWRRFVDAPLESLRPSRDHAAPRPPRTRPAMCIAGE